MGKGGGGGGGQLPPLRVLHYQLTYICKSASSQTTRWLESSTCIALESAPKVGVVIKVGVAHQNIL